MSTLAIDTVPLAKSAVITDKDLVVILADGRTLTVPLTWFPRLMNGTAAQRANLRLIGKGEGIHWPELDEDVSVGALLRGQRAGLAHKGHSS